MVWLFAVLNLANIFFTGSAPGQALELFICTIVRKLAPGRNFHNSNFLWTVLDTNFFGPGIFWTNFFLEPVFFWTIFFRNRYFWNEKIKWKVSSSLFRIFGSREAAEVVGKSIPIHHFGFDSTNMYGGSVTCKLVIYKLAQDLVDCTWNEDHRNHIENEDYLRGTNLLSLQTKASNL